MGNLKTNKNNLNIFILIAITIMLLCLVYKPILGKFKKMECDYKILNEKYKNVSDSDDQTSKVENQIQDVDSKIKIKRLSIPSEIKQKDVIELLECFRLKSKLNFYNIGFSDNNKVEDNDLIKMYINLEFSGDYNQFKKLVAIVNESNEKIVIEQLQMNKEYNNNNIKGSMTMVLYGIIDENF